ncbi:MAG TPA: FMN-binding protein [Limnobacter sp.]|uniref:FMN-binding protein n=1 Tax=Limnobacter sp. TaxID=2003368 RepID=UPI002EDA3CC0
MKLHTGAALLCAFACEQVHAVQYLSIEQAQKALFPEATSFAQEDWVLTAGQAQEIQKKSGQLPRALHLRVFQAKQGEHPLGYVVLDSVIGKFDLIDYAVAINADGAVRQLEILTYRESHGFEIRNAAWRAQFAGKTTLSELQVGHGIANISGATLSCTHVTDGVRRIAATAQVVLHK